MNTFTLETNRYEFILEMDDDYNITGGSIKDLRTNGVTKLTQQDALLLDTELDPFTISFRTWNERKVNDVIEGYTS